MTPERLAQELDHNLVRPDVVLQRLEHRRRIHRRRLLAGSITGALAAAAVTTGVIAGIGVFRSSNEGAATQGELGSTQSGSAKGGAADGCVPLLQGLPRAIDAGSSLIEAKGILTGRTGTDDQTPFTQMDLSQLRVLAGDPVSAQATGWIRTTPHQAVDASDAPGLWAQDGTLIAIYTPANSAHRKIGATIRLAPVVNDNVIYNATNCWSADPLLHTATWSGTLRQVPNSNAIALAAGTYRAGPVSDLVAELRKAVAAHPKPRG